MIKVLLLTNRDSDNVGDQIIEATVISLLRASFANLDIPDSEFSISTRAADCGSTASPTTGPGGRHCTTA